MKEYEIVNKLNSFLKKNQILFENEIRMGIGIPDVMFGFGLPSDHLNINNYFILKLLVKLKSYEGKELDFFLKDNNYKKNEIKSYLDILEKLNVISIKSSKIVFYRNFDLRNLGITVSVEVKVRDWKLGLLQAKRYLNFSDYSYLALPIEFLDKVNLDEIRKTEIGLLVIEEEDVYEVISPKKSFKCNEFSKYISISSILNKSKHSNLEFFTSSLNDSRFKKLNNLFLKNDI